MDEKSQMDKGIIKDMFDNGVSITLIFTVFVVFSSQFVNSYNLIITYSIGTEHCAEQFEQIKVTFYHFVLNTIVEPLLQLKYDIITLVSIFYSATEVVYS